MTIPESSAPEVVAVLLADGWHRVSLGSFTVGAFSLATHTDTKTLGYRFEDADDPNAQGPTILAGPLQAVLAIRQSKSRSNGSRAAR
jgi:hypothetical protein